MAATVSYNSYDFSNVILVQVIASFDTEGHIAPLYVRIDGISLKVHSFWLKPAFSNPVFQCQVIDNDVLKPLVLTYHPVESVWTIPKH